MTDDLKEIRQEPDQEVVEILESMLKQAKDGELRSFMAVKLFTGSRSGQSWAGLSQNSETTRLLGEILLMASQLSIKVDGVDAEDIRY